VVGKRSIGMVFEFFLCKSVGANVDKNFAHFGDAFLIFLSFSLLNSCFPPSNTF
jgi:DNA mismatch repair protein MutH